MSRTIITRGCEFDELNLDDQLVREHFSRRAENFIATVAEEEGLNFFLIGAVAPPVREWFKRRPGADGFGNAVYLQPSEKRKKDQAITTSRFRPVPSQ